MEVAYGNERSFVDGYRRFRYEQYARFQSWIESHRNLVMFGAALSLAILMGALAQVKLFTPLTPVPFTLQVFGAGLMGGLLGRKWGSASAGLYILLGVIGLPVFAGQVEATAAQVNAESTWGFLTGFAGALDWFGGWVVFTTSLSAWYIVGFVAQAYLVGHVVDMRNQHRTTNLVVLAPVAIGALILFALLEVYVLANYGAIYGTDAFPNVWFLLGATGILLIVGGAAWLALTTKARRERVELFFGNVVGLLAVYAIGAAGFFVIWTFVLAPASGLPALTTHSFLAYTVLPFIPVDVAKILAAVGLVTLLRPTNKELETTSPPTATES